MEKDQLIAMLNKDLADEHASIVRYLIHAYQVGEDTPFGSMLLSTAREEMWHMDWLGDEIGELEAEPLMEQGVYPHDPTSNATLLRSYIAWEDNLIALYAQQAEQVDSSELKRILRQLGIESITHKRRFEQWLEKLGPAGEEPFTFDEGSFSPEMLKRLHQEATSQYKLVLQHLRHAFVFEDEDCDVGSELELTAMRHMKHLSHFAEELAESGRNFNFNYPGIDKSQAMQWALLADLKMTQSAKERFEKLAGDPEIQQHAGLVIELDNMIMRNDFLAAALEEMLDSQTVEPKETKTEKPSGDFTVGSLLKKQ
ncbi:MAG: ferritin-like domain-containing protein [Anaerolineae bacterium]|nr:ferritin-like domain-containing protein [Anaerolineae bacterium]